VNTVTRLPKPRRRLEEAYLVGGGEVSDAVVARLLLGLLVGDRPHVEVEEGLRAETIPHPVYIAPKHEGGEEADGVG
jgi:hypothetical protein